MAKAAVEAALSDLLARQEGLPLSRVIGVPVKARVPVGVSVGMQEDPTALVRRVARYLEEGYRRIKLKVAPGRDRPFLSEVRRAFPDIEVWVDGNQAYGRRDLTALRAWASRYEVTQVEQPFPSRELSVHARLQQGAPFRVCLDESIVDPTSLEEALTLHAFRSLNVKPGRVGGAITGAALAERAARARIPSWVGGMLESGIGRAHNVHLATLAPFRLSNDLSASARYYEEDLITVPFVLGPGSTLAVPRGPGSGVTVDERAYRRALRSSRSVRLSAAG